MNGSQFCEHCGAQISAKAEFCKICGKPVAPTAPPALAPAPPFVRAQPPVAAPRPNRGLIVGLAIVGVFVVLGCLAIAAFGFLFMQSKPAVLSQSPVGTPQVGVFPTYLAPTNVPSPVAITIRPPTAAPLATTTPTMPAVIQTTTATQTPACPPTPALPAGVLFSDDFGSRQVSVCNGWRFNSSENGDYAWSANKYTISVRKKLTVEASDSRGEYDNFAVETQAQPVGNNYAEYGVVFRLTGKGGTPSSLYAFGISTDGKYLLYGWVAPNWVRPNPINATPSQNIKPGVAPNTIGVIVQGSTFSLYINRVLVKTITDNSITGKGRVGVFAKTGVDNDTTAVAFSRFTILTPEKAQAEWGGTTASSVPPVVSSSPQPEIVSLEFPSEIPGNGTTYDGLVRFRDGEGDIARISFDPAFVQPPGFDYQPFGFEFTNPAVRWVEGDATSKSGAFKFRNSCVGETIKATYTATLYDKAGNQSAPYPFSFVCKSTASNMITVFFTIQNGSPTGYVIDKQGVKHTPPGYLTISGFHVAPGDRIVVQTDQPRFSLLFDCGTSPKTFTPCDFVADTPAGLPAEIRKNASGGAYLNISRADNWAGTRPGFPSQRYPADPVLRIGFGD